MSTCTATTNLACRFAPETSESDPVVCQCKSVTESRIRAAVDDGAKDIRGVAIKTGACTGCTACSCRVNRVIMGLPAKCGGRFDLCDGCGCAAVICECEAA